LHGEYVALLVDLPKDVSDDITIQLVDKSPRAVPGTLAMALVAPNGSLLGPATDPAVTSETSGTENPIACDISTSICHISPIVRTATETDALTQSATIRINGSIGDRRLALLYNGATLSRFSRSTLKARFNRSSIQSTATLEILADPRVTTGTATLDAGPVAAVAVSLRKNVSSFGTGVPFGAFNKGINVAHLENQVERGGFDPATDSNSIFVGSGDRVDVLTSDGRNDGSIQLAAGRASAIISALAWLALKDGPTMLFATDRTCAICDSDGGIGVIAMAAEHGLGPPTPVHVLGNRIDFRAEGAGPLGLAALSDNQRAPSSQAILYVAARNSVYRLAVELRTPDGEVQSSGAPQLVAGSGITGARGVGKASGAGAAARFDFSGTAHVGMAFDRAFGRAHALYIADPGNKAIRRLRLDTNAVSTFAVLPGPPVGVTVDPFSGNIFASVPSLNAIYMIDPEGNVRLVAGRPNVASVSDGFAMVTESWANAASGSPFENLPLTRQHYDASRQGLLGIPLGLAFDAQSGSIVVVEGKNPAVRFLR
jgi:hypothetical protein